MSGVSGVELHTGAPGCCDTPSITELLSVRLFSDPSRVFLVATSEYGREMSLKLRLFLSLIILNVTAKFKSGITECEKSSHTSVNHKTK